MKTTLVIDDSIMKSLEQQAAAEGRTIPELVECALRLFLEAKGRCDKLPPLPTMHGGRPLVDVADRDALYRAMEGK